MSTTNPAVPGGPEGPPQPVRSASRVVAILTIALGAAIIIGALWSGAAPTVAAALTRSEERTVDVTGVSRLHVDVAAASFTVQFADVDEASLDIREARMPWTFERDGDTLRVESPDGHFLWWFSGGDGRGTLTLPSELEGVDARLNLGAGSIIADGRFGDLDIEIGAGELNLTGAADALTAEISAGRADIDLEDVRRAAFTVSAGDATAHLRGTAPSEVEVSVSAGSLDLTLPDEEYDVDSEVSAGDLDNGLRTAGDATRSVRVDVSAGKVRLLAD